jgi:hypothetical protein
MVVLVVGSKKKKRGVEECGGRSASVQRLGRTRVNCCVAHRFKINKWQSRALNDTSGHRLFDRLIVFPSFNGCRRQMSNLELHHPSLSPDDAALRCSAWSKARNTLKSLTLRPTRQANAVALAQRSPDLPALKLPPTFCQQQTPSQRLVLFVGRVAVRASGGALSPRVAPSIHSSDQGPASPGPASRTGIAVRSCSC